MAQRLSRVASFRQLEILLALDEQGGVARAAAHLHLTQPSASAQLKKLAEALGTPLYVVNGRNTELTEAGKAAVKAAREIFASLNRLDGELAQLQGLQAGRLGLSVVSTAEYFIPYLLGPFCQRYPKVDIDLFVGNREQVIERLQAQRDDLYFFSHLPDDKRLQSHPFAPNPLLVVAPKSHPLVAKAAKQTLNWQDLASEPFIVRERGSGARLAVEDFLKGRGLVLPQHMSLASNEAIKHAVIAGLGLAILSSHTLNALDREELVALDVEGFPICQQWYVAYYGEQPFSPLAACFRDYLLDEAPAILEDGLAHWEAHHRPKPPSR